VLAEGTIVEGPCKPRPHPSPRRLASGGTAVNSHSIREEKMEFDRPIRGTATIRVRNLVLENVPVVRLPDGEFDVPIRLSRFRFFSESGGNTKRGEN
jgi:hypothetical protein